MKDQTALCIALRAAGHTPDEIATMLDGWVWLGELSGVEVAPFAEWDDSGADYPSKLGLMVGHRLCAPQVQPDEGISADGSAYLGNIVERAVKAMDGHACDPREPSEEHKARVQRWEDSSGRSPRPVSDPLSVLTKVQLTDDRPDDEGEPVIKPVDGYGFFLAHRYADGPGCTPVAVRVECLGDGCTGCTDPQCRAAQADGGDA